MSSFNPTWIEAIATAIGVLLIPLIVLLFRAFLHSRQVDNDVQQIKTDLKKMVDAESADRAETKREIQEIIRDEKAVHGEILAQLRDDRASTDRRLRFIEEFWMKRGQGNPP